MFNAFSFSLFFCILRKDWLIVLYVPFSSFVGVLLLEFVCLHCGLTSVRHLLHSKIIHVWVECYSVSVFHSFFKRFTFLLLLLFLCFFYLLSSSGKGFCVCVCCSSGKFEIVCLLTDLFMAGKNAFFLLHLTLFIFMQQ